MVEELEKLRKAFDNLKHDFLNSFVSKFIYKILDKLNKFV